MNVPNAKLTNYITVKSSTTFSIYDYAYPEIKKMYIFALSEMLYLISFCFV
jgi:hypothetical protein